MQLKLLMDVLALIEEKSFTKAAQRRNVTQSAFSRRIRSIEAWLGYRCVDRAGNKITVTRAALEIEDRLRALVSQMNDLKSHMASHSQRRRHLVFTVPHTLSITMFARLVSFLNESRGAGSLSFSYGLKSAYKQECLAIFLRGEADFLVCDEPPGEVSIPADFECEIFNLGRDRLIPVASHTWSNPTGGTRPAGSPFPVIAYPETSYLWKLIARESFPALQLAHPVEIICETPLSAGVKEMVLEGIGIGWIPLSFARRELHSGKLVSLAEDFGGPELEIKLYISKNAIRSGLKPVSDLFRGTDPQLVATLLS